MSSSASRSDIQKEYHWINPWTSASKMNLTPLISFPPLLFDWEKIPADYHHLRPPLYKSMNKSVNIKEINSKGVLPAPLEFSIESLTRKPKLEKIKQDENLPDASELIKSRGRPSAVSLQLLKQKSIENPFRFKCAVCARSFPRKKSLDTHKLIHTDVKPYQCNFPGCSRKFKQSGQLKTHFRLHTGEKPFKCTFPMCSIAFTHSNRRCRNHPDYPLQRMRDNDPQVSYGSVFNINNIDMLYKQKVDAWLKTQLSSNISSDSSQNRKNVLGSIENRELDLKQDSICEESNKRLLSAVALVELHDQTKTKMENNNQGLLNTLFSVSK